MRDHQLTSLRNGVLAALGLLQACGGQTDRTTGSEPTGAASSLTPGGVSATPASGAPADRRCDPMAASNVQLDSCWEAPRYAWDGARCTGLWCSCAGAGCGDLFASAMSCYAERGGCDPFAAERAACLALDPGQSDARVQLASADCAGLGGTGCSGAPFLSEAAALCVARIEGLAQGVGPWSAELIYHSGHARITWSVSSTLQQDPVGGASGESLSIDATTGFVLESSGWALIPGRPFVVDHAPRTAGAVRRADYATCAAPCLDGMPAELRAAVAAAWTRVGLLEHASVAAFARFALQLLGLGAPAELVAACQRALQDELRHTRLAFGLASAYAEAPLGPGPLPLQGALDTPSDDLLAHVAVTTLVEGCIGETVAALDARAAAAHAADPCVRQVLATIAEDEERHALLAWRFVDWALAERPALARSLLAAARQSAEQPPETGPEAAGEAALLQHGFLPRRQRAELGARALEQVILPCLVALAGKHAPGRGERSLASSATLTA